jgi:hypothetical protein
MPKINFKSVELTDLGGTTFKQLAPDAALIICPTCREKYHETVPVTLADVIQGNLVADDQTSTDIQKFENFMLAEKIKKGGDVEISVEELVQIKKKVGQNPSPIIVGRVFQFINSLQLIPEDKKK